MAEIIVVWILALIVIAVGWGVIDRITIPLKVIVRLLQTPELAKGLEFLIASLLALAVFSIMVTAANSMEKIASLPAFFIWTGGLWLIPFRFDTVGHYSLSVLAIAAILILFRVGSTSPPLTRTYGRTDVPTQQGQDAPTSLTGLGFLMWIVLIGLTVAAIARYTSTWNAGSLSS